ncbi:MAG: TonB-dependent receptor [Acidobacteriota bacterium]
MIGKGRQRVILRIGLAAVLWTSLGLARAQTQSGTTRGTVVNPMGDLRSDATVTLKNSSTGLDRWTTTNSKGEFFFYNVPFGTHRLSVEMVGFRSSDQMVEIRSTLPVILNLQLSLPGSKETVTVEGAYLIERHSLSSGVTFDQNRIQQQSGARPGSGLQEMIATAPGWSSEDNGLLHARGVDDGFLFVTDGIPLSDRVDTLFAGSMDTEMIESMQVINGHIPVEYGDASGGVINVVQKSGIDQPTSGRLSLGGGNFGTGEISYSLRGNIKRKLGLFVTQSFSGSDRRYLDPVSPGNFNNRGGAVRFNVRGDWHPRSIDSLVVNLSINGSDFRVPNTLEQEQALQRQRQRLRDQSASASWQHIWSSNTVTNLTGYQRTFRSDLVPSAGDTPLSATQSRQHVRQGVLIDLTYLYDGHLIKMGGEGQRVLPDEFFSFFVTDKEAAAETELNPRILSFDRDHPFIFRQRAVRGQASWYLQDTFTVHENLTVNAGLRFDHTALLVSEFQFSPRVGAVFFIPKTRTALRGSYNRLFMTPQVENLLLSSSEEARQLSPFMTPEGEGGAAVPPERQHAFEVGFAQDIVNLFQLDAAYWWRFVRNYADPNVLLSTTAIFPNSIAKGEAEGLDLRMDFPERKGWSGYISYSNSRVFQVGPVNGGLFLEEEVIEISEGTRFTPDHDQRNVGTASVMYHHRKSDFWVAFSGRHESGTPLEVDVDELAELRERPGADRVNFARRRVRPRTLFDLSIGKKLASSEPVVATLQLDVRNLTNQQFAYNFGNPFSGTHFGHPRLWSARLTLEFN